MIHDVSRAFSHAKATRPSTCNCQKKIEMKEKKDSAGSSIARCMVFGTQHRIGLQSTQVDWWRQRFEEARHRHAHSTTRRGAYAHEYTAVIV